jgi:hypothetical protein
VAGAKAKTYAGPRWDPQDPNHKVIIGNEVIENNHKEIWLLVDYLDRNPNRNEQILLFDDALGLQWAPTTVTDSNDGGQTLYYWQLTYQPASESILFPTEAYFTLNDYVKDWDVATLCIPEPGSMALIVAGAAAIALRRRRPR